MSRTLRYAGEYQDSESGCYYLRARYYDPSTAQFLADPAAPRSLEAASRRVNPRAPAFYR